MGKVKLKRVSEWYNKNFEYEILINQDEMLELSSGEEKVVELELPVSIQARLWWCGSHKILINSLDSIQGVSVSANRITHGIAVFVLPTIFVACALLNVFLPELKTYLITTIVLCMVICLALLTIGRKTWLKLKLEK